MALIESWGGSQGRRSVPCHDCYSPNLCGRGRYCLYAQGIEARQGGDGETRLHRNDESPVGETDAPKDSASPTPQHKE